MGDLQARFRGRSANFVNGLFTLRRRHVGGVLRHFPGIQTERDRRRNIVRASCGVRDGRRLEGGAEITAAWPEQSPELREGLPSPFPQSPITCARALRKTDWTAGPPSALARIIGAAVPARIAGHEQVPRQGLADGQAGPQAQNLNAGRSSLD